MTSKEILQSSFLEILFENRNKDYGAYALRKQFDNRLGIALGVAVSSVFLMLILLSKNTDNEVDEKFMPDKEVVFTNLDFAAPAPPLPKLPMPKWKPAVQNGTTVTATFTQPVTFQAIEE